MNSFEMVETAPEQFAKMQRAVSIIRQIGRAWDRVAGFEAGQRDVPVEERQSVPEELIRKAKAATKLGDKALGIESKDSD